MDKHEASMDDYYFADREAAWKAPPEQGTVLALLLICDELRTQNRAMQAIRAILKDMHWEIKRNGWIHK